MDGQEHAQMMTAYDAASGEIHSRFSGFKHGWEAGRASLSVPQPIETAPKDQTRILVWPFERGAWVTANRYGQGEVWITRPGNWVYEAHEIGGWAPLPPALTSSVSGPQKDA